jgi:hypothetical protein
MSSNRRRLIFHCSRKWSEKASEQVAPTSERAMLSVSRGERDPPPNQDERQTNEDGSGF